MSISKEKFKEMLREKGLKVTNQRILVLEVLADHRDKHLTAEDIYELVREDYPEIGLATIYRTVQLLLEMQLVDRINLDDGCARYEIGHKQEIGVGRADIICELNGKRKNYEIEITEVNYSETKEKREIVFEVTDPELLATTGGIVQGMSGAPILQNGKVIGAVTHVYINNPTKGYGIFIEEMLK